MPKRKGTSNTKSSPVAESYRHPTAEALLRPDVGTQAQFKKKKSPQTYRYDSSLSPQLEWDGKNPARVYKRRQNNKGEEVGGIVPHITLKSIANNELPKEEVLVDRPEEDKSIIRVTGPFCFEATIPTPVDWEGDGIEDSGTVSAQDYGSFVDRMIEVLCKSPLLRLEGNRSVTLKGVRPPAKTLSLSAEAFVEGQLPGKSMSLDEAVKSAAEASGKVLPLSSKPVALVFGPENGAVSEKLVYEAAKEAYAKSYAHLFVFGFAIQPNARKLIEEAEAVMGISASYVQATPDLMMGDLLKNMRSSQIFSVCGSPEVRLKKIPLNKGGGASAPGVVAVDRGRGLSASGDNPRQPSAATPLNKGEYQVELLGLDVFDPITMEVNHVSGTDVPAWFLDVDYNGLCFHVSQAFFPRTSAWDSLKRALKGEYEDSVWEHLAGAISAPFEAGEHGQIAVKVIDQRGNELLVVRSLKEATG
ncbi:MAG: hypothetical protein L0312_16575 [Acidobacteria bacterium]|nr:hypothetical protein [Acidobacteriota bacterium]